MRFPSSPVKRVLLSAAGGLAIALAGYLLPSTWRIYYNVGIIVACGAASAYMSWDMRRMERERLEMNAEMRRHLDTLLSETEKTYKLAREVHAGRQELIRKVEELRGERWVN